MTNYLYVLSPLISLGVNIISQICCCRYCKRLSLLKSVFAGFAFGAFSLLLINICCLKGLCLSFPDNMASFLTNAITYSALGYGYFHFINLGETGRRIRIIIELLNHKKGLSGEEILDRYNAKDIIQKRINRLVESGQITEKNGRYYTHSPVLLTIARIIVGMKIVVLGKKSEFS